MPDIRVVVIDDELLARQRIEDLLAKEEHVALAGIATNGNDAVEVIQDLNPDLVFLDVQMPGLTGLQVAEQLGDAMPVTIFVTAYDQFAIQAFEVAATDYLVKPFDDERFAQALKRARLAIEARKLAKPASQYLERIPVESRGQVRVVHVSRIDYITASGPYAELHVGDRVFAVRERMQALEEQLDPAHFMRVHRSAIVQLNRVDALLRGAGGDYAVRLKNGTELSVSRNKRDELEARL
ncbi:MAG TPA: LytTR family DNA-binding domain-containing protein [Thermoanaerobaculia bacterium]